MAIADDIKTAVNGDIRWTGAAATTYSVLEFHRYLGALADDAEGSGDDLVDITSSTPSDRSTDQIVELLEPYNIDDTLAEHLYDGSITQDDGDTIYSGLEVVGSVVTGTEIMILQDNKILPAYWDTGINASGLTIMKILVKSRSGGADIDSQKIILLSRELGDQYKEFPVTLGLANSVGAISTSDDLNNAKSDTTLQGYTTISNTEGYQELDVDGTGATGQEFYSQWTKGSQSLNDLYERTKWISQRAHVADSGADTGTDYTVDNATIIGQGQEFSARPQNEKLVEMRFRIKVGLGTPTGDLHAELFDSDDVATAAPTGTVLATSEAVLATKITASYAEVIFRFNDNYTLTANQEYFAIIRHPDGDASNYFSVEGAAAGSDDGNRAEETGVWTGSATDIWFSVKSCPLMHGIAGEKFRGIDYEVVYDTEATGPFTENEVVFWGTAVTYDTLVSTFTVGEYVKFEDSGVIVNGGKVLKDTGTILTIALEDTTGGLFADGDVITGLSSGATAAVNVTIADDTKTGGEGLLVALDDNGLTGDLYIQLLSGGAPVDGLAIEGRTSGATAAVNVTVTARTISPEFIGVTTGTNLIGAYGVGPAVADVGASDKFFDLSNTLRTPPNNVTFTVTGLISGEDRVLVGPRTGSALETGQFLVSTALTGATETAIVIKTGAEAAPIPTDTPSSGTGTDNTRLRVELDNGVYKRQAYLSYTGSTFTIASTDYSGAGVGAAINNDVFLAYIDVLADATTEAFTSVYSADRDLFIRVRDGGATPIKTFEGQGQLLSTNQSIAAIRTSDA